LSIHEILVLLLNTGNINKCSSICQNNTAKISSVFHLIEN
jgi:hypothetical protein